MVVPFCRHDSVVRKIWGRADTVLFVFAGASAEFALNKAVDWLYFTGRLPADPIGRLFSTVAYARRIVFSSEEDALKAIDTIAAIHAGIEKSRGYHIPAWAYRDVLYMLIYYSIAAFELLEKKLTSAESEEVFNVFYRVGERMGLKELPESYTEWLPDRREHLENDLQFSEYSSDLFVQYKKHLGAIRFKILLEAQKLVVPPRVSYLLGFKKPLWLAPSVPLYKGCKVLGLESLVMKLLLPGQYLKDVLALNIAARLQSTIGNTD